MQGFLIADAAWDSHQILDSVVVPPGGRVVLGASTDPSFNGGAPVDYAWGGDFALGNGADEILLHDSTFQMLDSIYYGGIGWPDPAGASVSLDPASRDAASNNFAGNWCTTTAGTYGTNGDLGTPGDPEPGC